MYCVYTGILSVKQEAINRIHGIVCWNIKVGDKPFVNFPEGDHLSKAGKSKLGSEGEATALRISAILSESAIDR